MSTYSSMYINDDESLQAFIASTAIEEPTPPPRARIQQQTYSTMYVNDDESLRAFIASTAIEEPTPPPRARIQQQTYSTMYVNDDESLQAFIASTAIEEPTPPPRARIQQQRYVGRVVKVLGDGNCGPRSIEVLLYRRETADGSYEIRRQVIDFYRSNIPLYIQYRDFYLDISERRSFSEYERFMGQRGVHFTDLELMAISILYNVQIIVVDIEGMMINRFGDNNGNRWFIRYEKEREVEGHYDPMLDVYCV